MRAGPPGFTEKAGGQPAAVAEDAQPRARSSGEDRIRIHHANTGKSMGFDLSGAKGGAVDPHEANFPPIW